MHRGFLDLNTITLAVLKKKRIGDSTQWRTVKRNTDAEASQLGSEERGATQPRSKGMRSNATQLFFMKLISLVSLPCMQEV